MKQCIREPLKIHRTENRRNLFRHTSQKTFAEDKLCARIFVSSDEKSSRRSLHAESLEAPINDAILAAGINYSWYPETNGQYPVYYVGDICQYLSFTSVDIEFETEGILND